MNAQLADLVKKVLNLLVAEKYADIVILTHGTRLNAEEIARAIGEYGRKLIMPPEEGFQLMKSIEVKNARPRRWSIVIPLWTREEGRSDLTLEMTVIEQQNGFFVELNDLHVL